MRATRSRPARGQAVFAVGTVVIVSVALLALDGVGPKQPEGPAAGSAPSGAWICPHGGGKDWTVSLFLANPGSAPVTARLSELVGERPQPPKVLEVPSGTTVRVHLAADGRRSATYVEYFGGWIGAGWVTRPGPDEDGTAAEPCAAEASRLWYLADGTTQLGEEAYVIVANPFAVGAVVDVAIFTDRAPIRDSKWTNLMVPGRTSVALHLNERVKGEPAAAVELRVSVGRVAAASLGITGRTGIRSALGSTGPAPGGIFPLMQGSGQTELVLLSTAERAIRFGATLLSEDQPRPAGGLIDQELAASTAHAYAIPLEGGGAAAIDVFTLDEATAVGALRVLGPGEDPGSTAGSAAAASAWVIFPASSGGPSTPGAVLVNAGEEDTLVTLRILAPEGGTAAAPITVPVPAHSAAAVPPAFMAAAPGAAVSVRADGGPIVALTASTAPGGKNDGRSFALSMGVAVPQGP